MGSLDHIPGSESIFEIARFLSDPTRFLRERHTSYGDVFRSRLLFPVCFAIGPEANHAIHITERDKLSYENAYGQIAFGRLFEGSLLLKDGAAHKHDRDILQPAVGRLGLAQSLSRVEELWERATARLLTEPEVDAYEFARDTTFAVSANALVDLELDELSSWRELFEGLITGAMANTKVRFPFGPLDNGLKARDELIERLVPRIEAARAREPNGMVGLLAHHKEPDGSQLDARTAATGAWLLTKLALHPEWQDRLVAERNAVLGDRTYAVEDADKLKELGWVLKEVERLCPVVVLFPRWVSEDVEIAGHKVPAGTMMFWTPYLTHLLPRVFDDPARFDPERWGKPNAPATSLAGFGGGPRICLGKAFALVQLRVLTTTILRRFRIEHANGPAVNVMALPTHRPRDVRLRFVPRA